MSPHVIREQRRDLITNDSRVAEWHQHAPTISQQLPRVPVWRRHYRLTRTKTVGQRARGHLSFIEVRGCIYIAHRYEIDESFLVYELIQKHDMILDAELTSAHLEPFSIAFTFASNQVGMRGTEHDVDRIG